MSRIMVAHMAQRIRVMSGYGTTAFGREAVVRAWMLDLIIFPWLGLVQTSS
jgi:hypothetical protein